MDAFDGLFAEGDVKRLGLQHVRAYECTEAVDAVIVLAPAPDGVHIGCDPDELGEVAVQIAIVVGGEEQPFSVGSAVRIIQDGETREMNLQT